MPHLETGIFIVVIVLVERIGHGDYIVDDFWRPQRGGIDRLRREQVGRAQIHVHAQVVGPARRLPVPQRRRRRRRRILALYRRHCRTHT